MIYILLLFFSQNTLRFFYAFPLIDIKTTPIAVPAVDTIVCVER
jgi:hypothetical protein